MTSCSRSCALTTAISVVTFVALPLLAQSELEQYLAERRAAAMTEGAESQLRTVANILAGGSTFLAEKDADGSYVLTYSTALCLRPGTDSPEQQRLRTDIQQRAAVEFQRLKKVADFDHSGFVTGAEGSRLREVIELGLVIEQLSAEDATSARAVATALKRDEAWVLSTIEAYEKVRLSLDASKGAKLPAVPRALLAGASAPSKHR